METNNQKFLDKCRNKACFKTSVFSEDDFMNFNYEKPTEFITHFWNIFEDYKVRYLKKNKEKINNSYPGQAYGIILAYLFTREGIEITYMDEKIDVKNVRPDFLFIKNEKHFFVSIKTSGRERWKEAELEARDYKIKYPYATCVLVMHHEKEVKAREKDIDDLTLDNIIYSGSEKFNDLISSIKQM